MKVLFVVPEIRLDTTPIHIPFWAAILAAVVEKQGAEVGILDLNVHRMNFGGDRVPNSEVLKEIQSEKWDLIGIGGLTSTYKRIIELLPIIKKGAPDSIVISGGGWSTYNPDEIMKLTPHLDMIAIGEGEEIISEVYTEIKNKTFNFEKIKGLCLYNNGDIKYTEPRALISDLNSIPYPAYHLLDLDLYYKYSSLPISVESFNSKRRMSTVWERGCPRGCTFCSHNGMSRLDLQNIYGKGDKKLGEKLVREVDEANDTFQMPARWPTPTYAVNNIKYLHEKFDVDFISICDENMTSNKKWTEEFCELYIKEGLHKKVQWGTVGDSPSVAVQPHLVKLMKEAGCTYLSMGMESASDKVLTQDIKKGQLKIHLQKAIDAVKDAELTPLATFMIGNPHENIDDLMETVTFWIKNNIEVDPFICTPYVGSPLFYDYKDHILQQYDERLKMVSDGIEVDKKTVDQWKIEALDKFMKECGNATDYTATVSQNFSIGDLFVLKRFMYKKDLRRLLQYAHQRFNETKKECWNHDEKWNKYCNVCTSKIELQKTIEISNSN